MEAECLSDGRYAADMPVGFSMLIAFKKLVPYAEVLSFLTLESDDKTFCPRLRHWLHLRRPGFLTIQRTVGVSGAYGIRLELPLSFRGA